MNRKIEPLTFYPKPGKYIKNALACLCFAGLGVALVVLGEPAGWAVVALFGLGALILASSLIPGAAHLRLTEEGFEVKQMFRTRLTKWHEVEVFGYGVLSGNPMVMFNYSLNHNKHQTLKKIGRDLTGAEGAIDPYGMNPEELAQILEEWRRKFSLA